MFGVEVPYLIRASVMSLSATQPNSNVAATQNDILSKGSGPKLEVVPYNQEQVCRAPNCSETTQSPYKPKTRS